MSKLTDQQLDELFKGHLLDLEKEPPAGSWSMLAKDVAKDNFLKFSWKSFNIFYAAGIAAISVSAIVYFVVINSSSPQETSPAKKNIPLLQDTATIQQLISPQVGEEIIQKQKSVVPKEKNIIPVQESVSTPALQQDTIVPIVSEPVPEIKTPEPEKKDPKPKKIITVIKRDTVRVKDTVNLKRIHW